MTAVAFDKTGKYLAVGDLGGRTILFEYKDLQKSRYFSCKYMHEFQSHEPKIDEYQNVNRSAALSAIAFLH